MVFMNVFIECTVGAIDTIIFFKFHIIKHSFFHVDYLTEWCYSHSSAWFSLLRKHRGRDVNIYLIFQIFRFFDLERGI